MPELFISAPIKILSCKSDLNLIPKNELEHIYNRPLKMPEVYCFGALFSSLNGSLAIGLVSRIHSGTTMITYFTIFCISAPENDVVPWANRLVSTSDR